MSDEQRLLRLHTELAVSRDGLPTQEERRHRRLAQDELYEALADHLVPGGLGTSPLGPEWTDRFCAHVRTVPDDALLRARGWLPLGDLLGSGGPGWAVAAGGRVLAGVRICLTADDPVARVLQRCQERGEVRLREVLELRELARLGARLPVSSRVLEAAADIETGLGDRQLVRWASGRRSVSPAPLRRWRPRPRPLSVAVSGVDGSGKSSVGDAVARELSAASVHVSRVWMRPGMGLGPLARLAAIAKRATGQEQAPGVRAVAAQRGKSLRSRRGALGWAWTMSVTVVFLLGVRRQSRSGRGVVLYDRHRLDALATLDFAYAGVDLALPRALVRLLLPPADVSLYLQVPAEVAVARKPEDVLGDFAVREQLRSYERHLAGAGDVLVVDATQDPRAVTWKALEAVSRQASRSARS